MPSTPTSSAPQPITWRPAGPLRCGSRRLRQPTRARRTGTNQATRPRDPATAARVKSPTEPGSCHHTAAATTRARPIRKSPAPSRRCSGSRSSAWLPRLRAPAPRRCAAPIHNAATPAPSAVNRRSTGPGPLRTALGAGRLAGLRAGARPVRALLWLPDDRDRDAEPFLAEEPFERVPVGEDVRVATIGKSTGTPLPSQGPHAVADQRAGSGRSATTGRRAELRPRSRPGRSWVDGGGCCSPSGRLLGARSAVAGSCRRRPR